MISHLKKILKWGPVLVLLLLFPLTGHAEIIKLKGGSFVKGTVLKKNNDVVFIDIGYDILRVPASEVIEISQNIPRDTQVETEENAMYKARRMDPLSTTAGVDQFAPAVVSIRSPGGQGSGFLVNKEGLVITNFHVIKGEKHVQITRYRKGREQFEQVVHKDVKIVAIDAFRDLAVLRINEKIPDSEKLQTTILSPDDAAAVGEKVFVIGNPLGLERTVTEGVLSHTGRNFGGNVYLQIDAAVNPGNSGGPLFNHRGEIIGVINMGIPTMQGLNFAIPIRHVKFLLNHIDTFAFNEANSVSGYQYLPPPPNPKKKTRITKEKKNANGTKTGLSKSQ